MTSRPQLKGLARATRGSRLVERRRVALSREAEEALFRTANVISEGTLDPEGIFFGSTMITFDLELLARDWRGPLDALERERLLRAVEGSVRVRLRAMRIARAQAQQHVGGRSLSTAHTEMRMNLRGTRLHLDVDLEVEVALSSALSGT